MAKQNDVAIVGAGFIADYHAQALQDLPMTKMTAVFDVRRESAAALAKKFHVENVVDSADEIIDKKLAGNVHVCVLPNLHSEITLPFLESGINVFLEKPMAETLEQCRRLNKAAEKSGAKLCINHNFAFEPAFLKCKQILAEGELGNIHHIFSHWNTPLQQIQTKQFGHWMFQKPVNIILEQCVHPLSQICDLVGSVKKIETIESGRRDISPESYIYESYQLSLICEKSTAQLFYSVGQEYPTYGMTVICEDGQIIADFGKNVCMVQKKTRWPEFYDTYSNLKLGARQLKRQGVRNLSNYVLSTLGFKGPSGKFYNSMKSSIECFYNHSDYKELIISNTAGTHLVEVCEKIAKKMVGDVKQSHKKVNPFRIGEKFDVLLIGGTGFIGKSVLKEFVAAGKKVLVAARNINMLPEEFYNNLVSVTSADITDRKKMEEIIAGIPTVIHLAHGGGSGIWEEAKRTMIQGTINIVDACIKHGTKKLIHIGTIASLYLGSKKGYVTGITSNDPKINRRGVYSKAKAACDDIIIDLQKNGTVPSCILRPGVVLGEGGDPFHSGLGFYNQDAYMIGWNKGMNPLPFVLVEDVGSAIFLAAENDIALGKTYNIVGDVRLTAREYMDMLGKALGRKLHFIPQSPFNLFIVDIFKWVVKVFFQRRKAPFPSYRDFLSIGLVTQFDCSDIKKDLGWKPVSDRNEFIEKAINVHIKN